jgi:hypothetical protein
MTELRRLLEDTESDAERALLQAGRSYRSSRETRSKTLAALGLAGSSALVAVTAASGTAVSATVSATGASASTSVGATGVASTAVGSLANLATVAGASGAKILMALSLAGVGTAVPLGYLALHHRSEPPAIVRRVAPARAVASPPDPVAMALAADPAGGPDQAPLPPAADVSTTPAAHLRSGARPAAVSLSQELAALDAARATLARGNAEGALFLLDGYDRSCPHGRMGIEAEILRIDALAKNGQARAARRRAALFV